jgi:hypothetical protein
MAPGSNKLVTEAFKKAQEEARSNATASESVAETSSARPDEESAPVAPAPTPEPTLSPAEQEAARVELARKRKELRDADMATQRQLMKLLGNKSVPAADRAVLLDNLKKVTSRLEESLALERKAAAPSSKARRTYVNPALVEQKARGAAQSASSTSQAPAEAPAGASSSVVSDAAPPAAPTAPAAPAATGTDDRKSGGEDDEEDVDADW